MFLLIFFAATAIGISFLCSVMEAALLSITPSYIAQLEEKSPKWYKRFRNSNKILTRLLPQS